MSQRLVSLKNTFEELQLKSLQIGWCETRIGSVFARLRSKNSDKHVGTAVKKGAGSI